MQIEKIPLSQLVPDDRNARRHDERNIAEVKKSLQQFGQHRAFVVQRGSNKILVGNGMYEAMRQLGWEEADVYFVDDDDATAVRRALADNRTAELAEWDTDVLAHLFDNLRGGRTFPDGVRTRSTGSCSCPRGPPVMVRSKTKPLNLPRRPSRSRAMCGCWASTV